MANSKPLRIISIVAASLVAAIAVCPPLAADEDGSDRDARDGAQDAPAFDHVAVVYRGTVQDESGQPVSGVFPLDFKLYRSSMSANPVWEESHFVSVVDGRYQIGLGHTEPMPDYLLHGERWLGVELRGETELLRDRIQIETPEDQDGQERDEGERVSFADVAERAMEAERARTADSALSLDGMSVDEIEDLSNLALQRLGEHIADPDAHSARQGPSLTGRSQAADESAGGRGGTPYDIRCPAGHVVTGIQGSAGRVVDNVTVICTPLE